jgi:hypothetical protein
MDDPPNGSVILRPSWPLPDFGGRRISFGYPLMLLPGAVVIFATTRWVLTGLTEPALIVVALGGLALAIMTAYSYDGVTIAANRERVVITRWLRAATIMPVVELASLTLSTVEIHSRRRTFDERKVSFMTHEGQCILTLNWDKFTDDDLDQLSKVTGVRQDGGWFYKRVA